MLTRHAARAGLAAAGLAAGSLAGPHDSAQARPQVRAEIGFGGVYTDYDLSFDFDLGPLDLRTESDSALGGVGPLFSAGLWFDGVWTPNLTLGVEYLNGRTSSSLDLEGRVAGTTNRLDTDFRLETQSLFANLAWRHNEGFVHPYLGLGLGASWLEGRIRSDARTTFLGGQSRRLNILDEDALVPSAQFFAGFDYDLTERLYVGPGGRFFLVDGRLFEEDHVIRELSGQARAGIRF